jgi:flagellar hook-length control protein FliK
MTSAITRAPAGAAHAHGFAKSLKGDAPAEGFEALFAAVAAAQPAPVTPPVVGDAGKGSGHGKAGEGTPDDDKTSPQVLLMAASMTLVAPEAKVVDPRAAQAPANSQIVATAQAATPPRIPALENTYTDSTPPSAPAPATQRIVPNAAFAILEPVAHALMAHKGNVAEAPVPPTVDPPRITRAPLHVETAASPAKQAPAPVGAPVESHAEAETLSPAPPSSPSSPSTQVPAERTRTALSPRALVQAAMVEVVRSPGRGRTPPPDAANTDPQETTEPQTAAPAPQVASAMPAVSPAATPASVANAPVQLPPIAEQAVVADAAATIEQPVIAPLPSAKPTPTSRAAADIARQRQFVLASAETSSPTTADAAETNSPAFDTLIALGKADGALDSRAQGAPNTESVSPPAPSGAWLTNMPSSTTQALNSAAAVATPRTFDQAAWSAALAQQVTASAVAATRETTVRIKPDGLGPIEVRVRVESQHVDVRFAIEHPVTVNMVREALPDLQRMLAQSGLSLGDAQVAQQNAGSRGQPARDDASASQPGEDESASAIAAAIETRPRARVGLLDDFV